MFVLSLEKLMRKGRVVMGDQSSSGNLSSMVHWCADVTCVAQVVSRSHSFHHCANLKVNLSNWLWKYRFARCFPSHLAKIHTAPACLNSSLETKRHFNHCSKMKYKLSRKVNTNLLYVSTHSLKHLFLFHQVREFHNAFWDSTSHLRRRKRQY